MSMVFAMRLRLLKAMGFIAVACCIGCTGDITSDDGWVLAAGGSGGSLPVPNPAYAAGSGEAAAGVGAAVDSGVSTTAGTTDTDSPERTPDAGTGGESAQDSSSGSSEPSGETPRFSEVFKLLSDNCSGCHATGQGGLTIRSTDQNTTYTNLVDVSSVSCSSLKRVVPGDPDNSVLYMSIAHTTVLGCDAPPMPSEFTSLEDEDVTLIKRWIAGGAPND